MGGSDVRVDFVCGNCGGGWVADSAVADEGSGARAVLDFADCADCARVFVEFLVGAARAAAAGCLLCVSDGVAEECGGGESTVAGRRQKTNADSSLRSE